MQFNHILNIALSPFIIFGKSLLRFLDFKNTSTRLEFWSFMIVMWLLDALFRWVDLRFDLNVSITNSVNYDSMTIGITTFIFMSIVLLPLAAITVRRLHDINMRGWWAFVWLIPFIGLFGAIVLGFIPTRKNRWDGKNKTDVCQSFWGEVKMKDIPDIDKSTLREVPVSRLESEIAERKRLT